MSTRPIAGESSAVGGARDQAKEVTRTGSPVGSGRASGAASLATRTVVYRSTSRCSASRTGSLCSAAAIARRIDTISAWVAISAMQPLMAQRRPNAVK